MSTKEPCICARHLRTCKLNEALFETSSSEPNQPNQPNQKEPDQTQQNLVAHIKKFQSQLATLSDLEIAQWLLRLSDHHDLVLMAYDIACTSYPWLSNALIVADIFTVGTICEHKLPRPYSNCQCNFYSSHASKLLCQLEYMHSPHSANNTVVLDEIKSGSPTPPLS